MRFILYVCVNRSGRLGRLGNVNHVEASRCPTSAVKGWAGRVMGCGADLNEMLSRGRAGSCPALPFAGQLARKIALVQWFVLWLIVLLGVNSAA